MKIIVVLFACCFWTGPSLLAAENSEGKVVFQKMCSRCHQLPEPSMLKPKQWHLIVRTMQQRMRQASVPQLTDQESELVLEYLAEQARK